MPIVGDAYVRVRVISSDLAANIRDEVRRQLRAAGPDIDRDSEEIGRRSGRSIRRGLDREGAGFGSIFARFGGDAASKFGEAFSLGIGRERMGKGIIGILIAAGPSIISAGAAIATALAGEILVAMSAVGPGLLGLGAAFGAGIATALLNFGLLFAAFKSGAEGLKELKEEAGALAKELGTPIAQGMVGGFRDAVRVLRDALPALNEQLKTTGERFGAIAKSAAETLVSASNMERLKAIFATNNEFLDRFKNGFNDLITSFLILLNAAKPFIDYLGQGLEKFGAWAKSILEAKEGTGELGAKAQELLDRWKLLWQTIKDFAAGVSNVFDAIAPVGKQLADSLATTAAEFRAWTGDPANQERMTAFFQKVHDLSSKIFEILGKLFTAGGNAFLEADFTNLFAVMDSIATKLAPALADIFNQVQAAMGPHLVAVVENFGTAFQKIADSGAVPIIAGAIGFLLEKVSALLATDLGSWVLAAGLAWALFGGIIGPIANLLFTLVGAISGVGLAIAAAVAFFVLMWQNSENLRNAIGDLVTIVSGKFTEIWDKVSPKLEKLWTNIQELAGVIGDRLAPIIEFIGPIIGSFLTVVGTVLSFVFDQLGELVGFFADLFSGDFEGAWEHAKTIMSNFIQFIKDLFPQLFEFFGSIWEGIENLFVSIWDSIYAKVESWLTNTESLIRSVWDGIWQFFEDRWTEILAGLEEMVTGFKAWWDNLLLWVSEKASSAWEWVKGIFVGAYEAITGGITAFGNNIQTWWNSFWAWVWSLVVAGWEFVKGIFVGAYEAITSGIQNFGNNVQNWWNSFWSWVWELVKTGWETVKGIFVGAYNTITEGIRGFGNKIQEVWNGILAKAREIWDTIWNAITTKANEIVTGVMDYFSGLGADVRGAWDAVYDAIIQPIIDAYNDVLGWIESIKSVVTGVIDWISGKVTEVNSKLESILADQAAAGLVNVGVPGGEGGGIVVGGGIAEGGVAPAIPGGWIVNVAEGGRDERIEPLDRQGLSRRDRALVSHIVSQMSVGTSSGGATEVAIYLDGRQLTGVVSSVVTRQLDSEIRGAKTRRRVSA